MSPAEAELFFSLGEKWTKSRETWLNPADVVDFVPIFKSGWIMPPNNPPPSEHPIALLEQQFPDKVGLFINVKCLAVWTIFYLVIFTFIYDSY